MLSVTALVGASANAATPEESMTKAGCVACHAKEKKLVGPSYKDIAARYKGHANAVATLTDKVRKGGKGSFGPIPMSPNPPDKISDAELKAAVEYILAQ
ncbi:MAG: c-type cytochrome [Burkholderiales bacterium]|nr:c-type cytochrome [Burkholderiales bacterium]